MKRVLITGANGMLGISISEELQNYFNLYLTGKQEKSVINHTNYLKFDLSNQNYIELVNWANPDIVIHCAAITDGCYCQNNPIQAFEINSFSVVKLIDKLPDSTRFVYISTDAVFPSFIKYPTEKDLTYSESVYGKSKEVGEFFLLNSKIDYTIIRTTIVGYNCYKENNSFVEWIVKSAKNNKEISLFDDVKFTPISIWDFSKLIVKVLKPDYSKKKIHIAGNEICTKYDFGIKLLNSIGLPTHKITQASINNMKLRANRSNNQSIDCDYFQSLEKIKLPDIQQTINSLKNNYLKYESSKTWQ
jgi:dTDP-4-dehydrorhamnose reductase